MTKKQKTLVALMRAFFGELGIDKFLQKNLVEAFITLGWSIITTLIGILALVLNILVILGMMPTSPALKLFTIFVVLVIVIRKLLYFISGLCMLPGKESEKQRKQKIHKVVELPKEISKGKKLALALTQAFAGVYGVDRFLLKQVKKGVIQIVLTAISIFAFILSFVSFLFLDATSAFIVVYVVYIGAFGYLSVREIIFFIRGMIFLKKDPEEVLEYYNK